jgi:hypothetical protein
MSNEALVSIRPAVGENPMALLKRVTPSAFTTGVKPGATNRYTHVPTSEIVEHLSLRGWLLESAGEGRVRIPGNAPFVSHTVNLRHPDFKFGTLHKGDVFPTLMLGNSHDCTTAVWMRMGFKVCTCDNQNVLRLDEIGIQRFRHYGGTVTLMGKIYEAVNMLADHSMKAGKVLTSWKNTNVKSSQRTEYFRRVLDLRMARITELQSKNIMLFDERRRPEEAGNDLFTMYQVVQEHMTRGYRTQVVLPNGDVKERSLVRPISSAKSFVQFNEQLFDMTNTFAKEVVGV